MRWTPDTCNPEPDACAFDHHYEGVTDVFDATVRVCSLHQAIGLVGGQAHWDWVLDENKRKNGAFNIALVEAPELREDFYAYVFDLLRLLMTVSFPGLSIPPPAKARIQAACDLQFGLGRVLIL